MQKIKFIKTRDGFYYNLGKQGCYNIEETPTHFIVHESDGAVKVAQYDVARVKYIAGSDDDDVDDVQPADNSNKRFPSDG